MPAKPTEYRLTPQAEQDVELIWRYTLGAWGWNRPTELTSAFAQLVARPKTATPCNHIRKGYRCGRAGQHAIYFKTTDYGIAVVRMLHDRMLLTRHL